MSDGLLERKQEPNQAPKLLGSTWRHGAEGFGEPSPKSIGAPSPKLDGATGFGAPSPHSAGGRSPTLLGARHESARCATLSKEALARHTNSYAVSTKDSDLASRHTAATVRGSATPSAASPCPGCVGSPSVSPMLPGRSERHVQIAALADVAGDAIYSTEEDHPKMIASEMSTTAYVRSFRSKGLRRMSRRQSTLRTASRNVPLPMVPASAKPNYSGMIENTTVREIKHAILMAEQCPLQRFLDEVAGCEGISATDWMECTEQPGTQVRKVLWSAAMPADMSDTIRRLLSLPPQISGTTVWRLQDSGGNLALIQHSYSRNVMYGDRFRLQNTLRFSPSPSGNGVQLDSFADTIWVSPLPWTHAGVKVFLERRSRAEAAAGTAELKRLIEEALPTDTSQGSSP